MVFHSEKWICSNFCHSSNSGLLAPFAVFNSPPSMMTKINVLKTFGLRKWVDSTGTTDWPCPLTNNVGPDNRAHPAQSHPVAWDNQKYYWIIWIVTSSSRIDEDGQTNNCWNRRWISSEENLHIHWLRPAIVSHRLWLSSLLLSEMIKKNNFHSEEGDCKSLIISSSPEAPCSDDITVYRQLFVWQFYRFPR